MRRLDTKALALAALLGLALMAGCGSDSTLSPQADKDLRENFGRTMSEDEVNKLRNSGAQGGGAAAPAGAETN